MRPTARFIPLLLAACSVAPVATPDVPAILVGEPAPELRLSNLDGGGESVTLSGSRGEVVVVTFWATGCEPCKAEFPRLQALYDRLGPRGFVILALSEDEPLASDAVRAFLRSRGTSFPAGWDEGHLVAEAYRPGDLPSSYVVDRRGTVRFQHIGYRPGDERELEREVVSLLDER